jgi:hypothetical protein
MIEKRLLPGHRLGRMNKTGSARTTRRSRLKDGDSKRKSQGRDRRK